MAVATWGNSRQSKQQQIQQQRQQQQWIRCHFKEGQHQLTVRQISKKIYPAMFCLLALLIGSTVVVVVFVVV